VQSVSAVKERITDHKTANLFLSSMSRNSLRSKLAYQFGLMHFQRFLKQKHPQYNIETVLKSLANNELDIYVILDELYPT
jgi:hypothetical protein